MFVQAWEQKAVVKTRAIGEEVASLNVDLAEYNFTTALVDPPR